MITCEEIKELEESHIEGKLFCVCNKCNQLFRLTLKIRKIKKNQISKKVVRGIDLFQTTCLQCKQDMRKDVILQK